MVTEAFEDAIDELVAAGADILDLVVRQRPVCWHDASVTCVKCAPVVIAQMEWLRAVRELQLLRSGSAADSDSEQFMGPDAMPFLNVGKKRAGRELDGRAHDAMPRGWGGAS